MVLDADDELPWDPLWAYVLGEEEDNNRGFRRKKKESSQGEGFLSYIKDVLPAPEGRDDDGIGRYSDNKTSRDDKKKKGFIWRRNNAADEAQHTDSWEWHISTGSSIDDFVPPPTQPRDGPSAKERWSKLARDTRTKEAPVKDATWNRKHANSAKKDKRGLGRRFGRNKEPDKWDFITTTSQEKGARKVLFSRSSSKNNESWIDTKEVIAQLETSQNTFFDWVGINPSFDEEDAKASSRKKLGPIAALSREKKQQQMSDSTTMSDSGFLFGDIFSSFIDENEETSDDGSSFQSSTEGSSASTIDEEGLSDDDSRSVPTLQSDTSLSQTQQQAKDSLPPHLHHREVNEVRLSFQPINQDEIYSNHLSVIEEEHSDDDVKVSASEVTITESNTANNPEEAKIERQNNLASSSSYDQSRSPGRRICCSVKNLPYEQLKWSEESGIPFHELSREEQSSLNSNKASMVEDQKYVKSGALDDHKISSGVISAKSWTSQPDPLSLFKYDCNSSVQMYVSYDQFGSKILKVTTAPTPRKTRRDNIWIKVEASTVSCTDVAIRQGCMPNKYKMSLPIIPGIDVVGRVHQVNAETSQRYGLKVGDRVISLVKSGGNARYLSVNAINAISVPESADPVETVCLAETYLTAFQILHNGQAQRIRYRDDSLKGKTILMRGFGISVMGHAIAQLAFQAGAIAVHSLAERNHFDYLASIGINPIENQIADWKKDMAGKIDVLISSDDDCADVPFKLLKGNGQAIILKGTSKRSSKDNSLKLKKGFLSCFKSMAVQHRISLYNVHEEWDKNLDWCKLDLQHLIFLIENRKVEPKVLERVSLGNVAQAQELVASKQLKGFIVCEPWLLDKSKTICL